MKLESDNDSGSADGGEGSVSHARVLYMAPRPCYAMLCREVSCRVVPSSLLVSSCVTSCVVCVLTASVVCERDPCSRLALASRAPSSSDSFLSPHIRAPNCAHPISCALLSPLAPLCLFRLPFSRAPAHGVPPPERESVLACMHANASDCMGRRHHMRLWRRCDG